MKCTWQYEQGALESHKSDGKTKSGRMQQICSIPKIGEGQQDVGVTGERKQGMPWLGNWPKNQREKKRRTLQIAVSPSVINQLALHPKHYNINDMCKLRSVYLASFIFPRFPPYSCYYYYYYYYRQDTRRSQTTFFFINEVKHKIVVSFMKL